MDAPTTCAWCSPGLDAPGVSHVICPACMARYFPDAEPTAAVAVPVVVTRESPDEFTPRGVAVSTWTIARTPPDADSSEWAPAGIVEGPAVLLVPVGAS